MDAIGIWEIIYYPVTLDAYYLDYLWDYVEFIFPIVFLQTFVSAWIIGILFYNVFGNVTIRLGNMVWWVLFLFISGLLGFYFGYSKTKEIIYIDVEMGSDGWIFAFTNMAWGMLLYFIGSLIFKWHKISTYARQLPFVTPW